MGDNSTSLMKCPLYLPSEFACENTEAERFIDEISEVLEFHCFRFEIGVSWYKEVTDAPYEINA